MGLISSNFRMMYLTAYRLTLENQIQYISSAKMDLCTSKDEILALGNNLDPDNPAVKEMEGRRDKLAVLEKRLDLQMKEYQSRIEMVDAELKSCEQAFQNAIERSFSYKI